MQLNELIQLIEGGSEEEKRVIRELVAPDTKRSRLQLELQIIRDRLANAYQLSVNLLNDQFNRIADGNLNYETPTWEQLLAEINKG